VGTVFPCGAAGVSFCEGVVAAVGVWGGAVICCFGGGLGAGLAFWGAGGDGLAAGEGGGEIALGGAGAGLAGGGGGGGVFFAGDVAGTVCMLEISSVSRAGIAMVPSPFVVASPSLGRISSIAGTALALGARPR